MTTPEPDSWTTDIRQVLEGGEGQRVEFKLGLPSDKEIARVLVGFANAEGGLLLIGVDDQGTPRGLTDEEVQRCFVRVQNICASLFSVPGSYQLRQVVIEGRSLVLVMVDRAPSYLTPIATATGEVYERKHERTERVSRISVERVEEAPREVLALSAEAVAFVAMSFRTEEEPHLEDYYRAMERAVNKSGVSIHLKRVDLEEGDFEISQKVMNMINESDIVIADFTLSPANVYFELGYARGAGKRIIQTARQGTALEFDVRNWKTLFYKNATELEERLSDAIVKASRETVPHDE